MKTTVSVEPVIHSHCR